MRHVYDNIPMSVPKSQDDLLNMTLRQIQLMSNNGEQRSIDRTPKFNDAKLECLPSREGMIVKNGSEVMKIKDLLRGDRMIRDTDVYMRKFWDYWGTDPEFQIEKNRQHVGARNIGYLVDGNYLDGCSSTGEWRNNKPCTRKDIVHVCKSFVLTYFRQLTTDGYEVLLGSGKYDGGTGHHVWFEIPPWWTQHESGLIDTCMSWLNDKIYSFGGVTDYRERQGYGKKSGGDSRYDRAYAMEFRRFPSLMCSPFLFGIPFYFGFKVKDAIQKHWVLKDKHSNFLYMHRPKMLDDVLYSLLSQAFNDMKHDFPDSKHHIQKMHCRFDAFRKGKKFDDYDISKIKWNEWTSLDNPYGYKLSDSSGMNIRFQTDRLDEKERERVVSVISMFKAESVDSFIIVGLAQKEARVNFLRVRHKCEDLRTLAYTYIFDADGEVTDKYVYNADVHGGSPLDKQYGLTTIKRYGMIDMGFIATDYPVKTIGKMMDLLVKNHGFKPTTDKFDEVTIGGATIKILQEQFVQE